jgi:subtilisin family serine protease
MNKLFPAGARWRAAFFCLGTIVIFTIALPVHAQKHTPPPRPAVAPGIAKNYPEDRDGDRISDRLKEKAAAAKTPVEARQMVEVVLVFTEQITQDQIDAFEKHGGEIDYIYQTISYGWNARLPLNKVTALPQLLGGTLVLVEESRPVHALLDRATQYSRARQTWTSAAPYYGNRGSTNITIGIMDTGLDSLHADLTNRCVYWTNWITTESAATPLDSNGHGTHVAAIALGTGRSGGTNAGTLSVTQTDALASPGSYHYFPFTVPTSSMHTFNTTAIWAGGGNARHFQGYRATNTTGSFTEMWSTTTGLSPRPLSGLTDNNNTGRQFTLAIVNSTGTTGSDAVVYGTIGSYPAVGDGFARMSGVAPLCNYAAAKVLDNTGNGSFAIIAKGLDDLVTKRITYNIKVVNMSLGMYDDSTVLRQSANNAVNAGVIVVAAAGNSGTAGSPIVDPGRAAMAITVGAANDVNQLTDYTSVGFASPSSTSPAQEDYKPDLMAPGGSSRYGQIFSADSGTADTTSFSDQQANDYTGFQGTSMSAPVVAGAAALIINAMEQSGRTWDFNSSASARFVKMLLCATASESNAGRENNLYNPTLQRNATGPNGYPLGKDQYEGYGMINVDAAVQAVRSVLPAELTGTNITLGSSNNLPSDSRVWATQVNLDKPRIFSLNKPSTGVFDLYLYSTNSSSYGTPVLLGSVRGDDPPTGFFPSFTYAPTTAETAILVLKRVSGYGQAALSFGDAPNDMFAYAWSIYNTSGSVLTSIGDPFSPFGYNNTAEPGEPSHQGYGPAYSDWWKWTAPVSGIATFTAPNGDFQPCLGVYIGTVVSNLTSASIISNSTLGQVVFNAVAGTTYRIAVDYANSGIPWNYTMNWSMNQAPTLSTMNTLAGTEDIPLTISYATLKDNSNLADGDTAAANVSFRIESLGSGTLKRGGTNVTVGALVNTNDTQSLIWTPATNVSGIFNVFTVKAWDGAIASDTAVQVKVNVAAVNDPPTLTDIQKMSGVSEDVPFTISYSLMKSNSLMADIDSLATNLSFRVESVTSGTLTKNNIAVTNGVTLLSTNETLVWTTATNAYGTTVNAFTVRVWDGFDASTTVVQVKFNVTPVNDAPTLTAISTLTNAVEDTLFTNSFTTLFSASDIVDVDGTTPSFRIESLTSGTLTKNGTNVVAGSTLLSSGESIVWKAATNANGTLNAYTVRAWDGTTNSSSVIQVRAEVLAVNDVPTLTAISTLTNATEDTLFSISYSSLSTASDIADQDGTTPSFRIESLTSGTLTRSGTNVVAGSTLLSAGDSSIVWRAATNANGTLDAFTVRAWDGTTNSTSAIQVRAEVAAVNDWPVVANPIPDQNLTYGTFYSYTIPANEFYDAEGDTLIYEVAPRPTMSMPSGISFNTTNRTFSGTPTTSGAFGFTVGSGASDGVSPQIYDLFDFIIAKAALSVTPQNIARSYGATNPTLTGTIVGIANSDNITATYSTTATTNSPPGTYPITVTLVDPSSRLGHYTTTLNQGTLTITNANTLPLVSLTQPTLSDVLKAGLVIDLAADASDVDGTVAKVEFLEGTNKLGEDASSPYTWPWTNTLAGTFSLTARAVDNGNQTNTSAPVVVTVHPYLHSPQFISSQFTMHFFGKAAIAYDLQYSTNFSNWFGLNTVTGMVGGVAITDPAVPATNRFYRAVESVTP